MRLKGEEKKELIGKKIKIIDSNNKTLVGLQGKIIDETKNTITIETKDKEKKILKNQVEIILMDENKKIKGKNIIKRPEERLK